MFYLETNKYSGAFSVLVTETTEKTSGCWVVYTSIISGFGGSE